MKSKKPASVSELPNYIRRKTKFNAYLDKLEDKGVETITMGNNVDPSGGFMNTKQQNMSATAAAQKRVRTKPNSRVNGNLQRPIKKRHKTRQAK